MSGSSGAPSPPEGRRSRAAPAVRGLKVAPGALNKRLQGEFTYHVIETSAHKVTLLDKRSNERLRTRLRGGLVSDRGDRIIVDCLIQDRSRSGARLRLSCDKPLPQVFLLADDVSRTRFWAQLAWQKGCDAGVRLVAI